jgi:hypothetical protein
MQVKGKEREDAAGAHPDVDADDVLRDAEISGL